MTTQPNPTTDYTPFTPGPSIALPFKDEAAFTAGFGICYIPEHWDFNDGPGLSFADFMRLTEGDWEAARTLFDRVEWQHPQTLMEEEERHLLPPPADTRTAMAQTLASCQNALLLATRQALTTFPKKGRLLLFPTDFGQRITLGTTYSDDSILDYLVCLERVMNADGTLGEVYLYTQFGNRMGLERLGPTDLCTLVNALDTVYDGPIEVSDNQKVYGVYETTDQALDELYSQQAYIESHYPSATLLLDGYSLSGSYVDRDGNRKYLHIELKAHREVNQLVYDE